MSVKDCPCVIETEPNDGEMRSLRIKELNGAGGLPLWTDQSTWTEPKLPYLWTAILDVCVSVKKKHYFLVVFTLTIRILNKNHII